jgi:probable rRNA maturation factor
MPIAGRLRCIARGPWRNIPVDRVGTGMAAAASFAPRCHPGYGQAMELEITIEDWPEGEWEALAARAAAGAGEGEPLLANPRLVLSLLLTSDAKVQGLNRTWRGRDRPTNVLSFPMLARAELEGLAPQGPPVLLGDIALAYETCAREAADKGISLAAHATHLIVHGLLHLAGHDHVSSEAEAEAMEALERAILAKLGLADPYGN